MTVASSNSSTCLIVVAHKSQPRAWKIRCTQSRRRLNGHWLRHEPSDQSPGTAPEDKLPGIADTLIPPDHGAEAPGPPVWSCPEAPVSLPD